MDADSKMDDKKDKEKKFIDETKQALQSHNYRNVHMKIEELKATGKVSILPYLLDLLNTDYPESIKQEVLLLAGDLKYQGCVQVLIDYIRNRKVGKYLTQLIASCWQSSLDFSDYLEVFAECFIAGDYQTALESFTVIEEMLWRSKVDTITACRTYLESRSLEVEREKQPLFDELLKLLDDGRTANSDDYPDLYMN
jgi:hypothetical protein